MLIMSILVGRSFPHLGGAEMRHYAPRAHPPVAETICATGASACGGDLRPLGECKMLIMSIFSGLPPWRGQGWVLLGIRPIRRNE